MGLGFKSAYGHPVMCAIIFAMLKLRVTGVTGFNPLSKDAEDTMDEDIQGLEK
jgi:hypothetical protein